MFPSDTLKLVASDTGVYWIDEDEYGSTFRGHMGYNALDLAILYQCAELVREIIRWDEWNWNGFSVEVTEVSGSK